MNRYRPQSVAERTSLPSPKTFFCVQSQLSELDRLKQLESELGHDLGQMSQHNKHLQVNGKPALFPCFLSFTPRSRFFLPFPSKSEFVQEQESWNNDKAKRIAMVKRLKDDLSSAQSALHELEVHLRPAHSFSHMGVRARLSLTSCTWIHSTD